MKKIILSIFIAALLACPAAYSQEVHRAAAPGAAMKALIPDISAIVNTHAVFSEDKSIHGRDRLSIREIELAIQSYVYPGVFGDIILNLHPENGHWDVDVEEAYLAFYELPWGLQADVGRKYVEFGRLNPVHEHHWFFTSFPLAFENIFGDHNWFDDGVQMSKLVPNPWDRYVKLTFGLWSGEGVSFDAHNDGHAHNGGADIHEDEGGSSRSVYTGRVSANLFHDRTRDVLAGFSLARDSSGDNTIYGFDLTYKSRRPYTQRRFRWQSEVFRTDSEYSSPLGFYSLGQLSLDANWDVGVRYDWTELMEDDHETEWAASAYVTYHFSEMMYLRPEYRYHENHRGEGNSTLMLQLVWGFGPHAHRIED